MARDELQKAVEVWQQAGEGMHVQASLAALEGVRKRLEAQLVDAGRLVVFHAAPLAEYEAREGTKSSELKRINFSKRLGIRAWHRLRSSLADLSLELKVQLEVATVENLQHALQQADQPMLRAPSAFCTRNRRPSSTARSREPATTSLRCLRGIP